MELYDRIIDPSLLTRRITAVSYTHLDVYKRQVVDNGVSAWKISVTEGEELQIE